MIVNFFTFGGVRRANEQFYRKFYDELSQYCASLDPEHLSNEPFNFSFETDHYYIEIGRTQSGHIAPLTWRTRVNIIAIKDGSPLSTEISDKDFTRACEVLSVRGRHNNFSQYAPVFTDSGLKNFENLHMKALTLSGNACSYASFHGPVFDLMTLKDMNIEATTFDDMRVNEIMLIENVTGMGLSFRHVRLNCLELLHSTWQCCDLNGLQVKEGFFVSSNLTGCYGRQTQWRAISAYETTLQSCSLIDPEFSSPYGLRESLQDSYIHGAYCIGYNGTKFPIENSVLVKK